MGATHDCGGTILTGGSGDQRHAYCERCGAFRYGVDVAVPTGTDRAANRKAWDDGEDESADA